LLGKTLGTLFSILSDFPSFLLFAWVNVQITWHTVYSLQLEALV
jgi:hypothetical protein